MYEHRTVRRMSKLGCVLLMLAGAACADSPATESSTESGKLLIIGQDLGAIRGYMASDCCPRPDGLTAYLGLYDVLKDGNFGGLGIDAQGNALDFEIEWGAGPVGAWQTATEFPRTTTPAVCSDSSMESSMITSGNSRASCR